MIRFLVGYGAALLTLVVLDFAWLGTIGAPLFRKTLGDVLAPSFAVAPAVLFYLVYASGVMIFAILPAFESRLWTTALLMGALFGFFAYATYDLTNLATLRNWTAGLTAMDMAWGTFLTAAAATAGFFAARLTGQSV